MEETVKSEGVDVPIKKFKDWKGWLDGLRSKAMKAGAEAVVTNLGALMGTNAVASMGIDALKDLGMNWKQFLFTMAAQFAIRTTFAAATYVANKPDPDIIEQSIDTDFFGKPKTEKEENEKHDSSGSSGS